MAVSQEYYDYLLELFEPLGSITLKRMFGGVGVFYRGLAFCLVLRGNVHFKVDENNLGDFEEIGAEAFSYVSKNRRRSLKSYYKVPDEILENEDDCLAWARKAIDAALAAERKKVEKKARTKKQN